MAVRIPRSFAAETNPEQNSVVELLLAAGKIIVEPCRRKSKYSLTEMLAGINEQNIQNETDWVEPVGKELL